MKNWHLGLGLGFPVRGGGSSSVGNYWKWSSGKNPRSYMVFVSLKEQMKDNVSQSILDYQQYYQLSYVKLARELGGLLTKDDAYDICHKNLTNFSLAELVIYANNLGIAVPCRYCEEDLFPSLWEGVILFLKAFEDTPPRQVSQLWTKHRHN